MKAAARRTDTFVILFALFALWEILHRIAGETALPAPLPTLAYLLRNLATPRFAANLATTAVELSYALLIAYGIGIAVGLWMGAHRLSGAVGEPILVALYSLPKIVLYPVVLLVFGLGISGKVAFGALHGILPVALLTMGAIRAIPPVYLRAARSLHLSPWQIIATVLLPAALPEVFTGLRIGFTVTLLGVLLGEMFASKQGLGFMIMNAEQILQGEEMMSVAIVLFAFAALANALLLWIEHRLHRRA